MTDREYLKDLANTLRTAVRHGASIDSPEGARAITLSDTLAKQITERLDKIVESLT